MAELTPKQQRFAEDLLAQMIPLDEWVRQIEPETLKSVRRMFISETDVYHWIKAGLEEVANGSYTKTRSIL